MQTLAQIRKLLAALVGFVIILLKENLGIEVGPEFADTLVEILIALLALIGVFHLPNDPPKEKEE
jgi:uncharacterized membrane protein